MNDFKLDFTFLTDYGTNLRYRFTVPIYGTDLRSDRFTVTTIYGTDLRYRLRYQLRYRLRYRFFRYLFFRYRFYGNEKSVPPGFLKRRGDNVAFLDVV